MCVGKYITRALFIKL
nr:unnamed protein product [Callosobruchus analis]